MVRLLAGSAIGGIVFPIMLNKLLNSSIGFAWTVRIAAFVVFGCLAVANLLIRPRVKPSDVTQSMISQLKVLFTDMPYMLLVSGYVFYDLILVASVAEPRCSAFISLIGIFYPCIFWFFVS